MYRTKHKLQQKLIHKTTTRDSAVFKDAQHLQLLWAADLARATSGHKNFEQNLNEF